MGNVTTDGASIYDYDVRNHLGSRQVGATTVQNLFTADGRLARMDDGAVAIDVVLDPSGRRLAKLEGGVWRDYVYLGARLIGYLDQGTTDPMIVVSDHIGLPMQAIDGTGALVWDAKAEPYGQLRGTVNSTYDPGLRYPGQWQDRLGIDATCVGNDCTFPTPIERSVTLYENGYRWYRADLGRYTQADPISADPRLSSTIGPAEILRYARGNPAAHIDSLGLRSEQCCECPAAMWELSGWASGHGSVHLGMVVGWRYDFSGIARCNSKENLAVRITGSCYPLPGKGAADFLVLRERIHPTTRIFGCTRYDLASFTLRYKASFFAYGPGFLFGDDSSPVLNFHHMHHTGYGAGMADLQIRCFAEVEKETDK